MKGFLIVDGADDAGICGVSSGPTFNGEVLKLVVLL